ncbi:MAG: hypothetical protein ACJ77K_02810 [Bacteroidia bacterium]
MKKFLLPVFALISISCRAQKIELNGTYQGKNMYIQNSYAGTALCTEKVLVNGTEVSIAQESAYEIHLDSMHFKTGDPLKIEIYHKPDCIPKVLNDNSTPKKGFYIESIKIDTVDGSGILKWVVTEDRDCIDFEIQQFRWNKWITIDTVPNKHMDGKTEYSWKIPLHSGKNEVRLYQKNDCISRTAECSNAKDQVRTISYCGNGIKFNTETDYEVYDQYGTAKMKGHAAYISFEDLEKGQYFLNYDDKMGEFIVSRNKSGNKETGKIRSGSKSVKVEK